MGAYYGLYNLTKNQRVSLYWKSNPYCDIQAVMHVFGWDITDVIISAAYSGLYLFEYDAENNQMTNFEPLPDDPKREIMRRTKENSKNIPEKIFGYPGMDKDNSANNHAPKWNNGVCQQCQYKFDCSQLSGLEKSFNPTFYMN